MLKDGDEDDDEAVDKVRAAISSVCLDNTDRVLCWWYWSGLYIFMLTITREGWHERDFDALLTII